MSIEKFTAYAITCDRCTEESLEGVTCNSCLANTVKDDI